MVIDDADLGIRDGSQRGLWPISLSDQEPRPWVLLEDPGTAHRPGCSLGASAWPPGQRWSSSPRSRTSAGAGGDVSRGLSWERTARALAGEALHNPRISALSRCAYAVYWFGPAGAVLLANPPIRPPQAAARA